MPATYSVVPTVATGDWITAGWVNTYIGGNLAANWPGTAGGDMEYYVSAVEKARLAKPSVGGTILKHNGTVPGWLAIGANGYILASIGGALTWVANPRYITALLNAATPLVTGDDAFRFRIPAGLN